MFRVGIDTGGTFTDLVALDDQTGQIRTKEGPFGLWKGRPGVPTGFYVRRSGDGKFRTFSEVFGTVSPTKFINIRLHRGDQILIESPGGGGYGDPAKRSDNALRADLLDRFITLEGLGAYGRSVEFAKCLERFS